MNAVEEQRTQRRRMVLLAPLIVGANALLLLGMVGLCFSALRASPDLEMLPAGLDADQRIVNDYIADSVPSHSCRVRQWFPARSLEGCLTDIACARWEPVAEQGLAQRVKLEVCGLHGPTQLDMVYWVQDGKVTRGVEKDHFRFAGEPVPKWELRDRR